MTTIRDYINIVEATWWPQKPPPPSPATGMRGVAKTMAPPLPDNFSIALHDLAQAAYQLQIGREDYYDQFMHLATTLKTQAPPDVGTMLDRIIADPSESGPLIDDLKQRVATEFA